MSSLGIAETRRTYQYSLAELFNNVATRAGSDYRAPCRKRLIYNQQSARSCKTGMRFIRGESRIMRQQPGSFSQQTTNQPDG